MILLLIHEVKYGFIYLLQTLNLYSGSDIIIKIFPLSPALLNIMDYARAESKQAS